MAWLSTALAFGITMLILSMIVSTIVETLHRLFGLREKGLRMMLGHLYERVIKDYVIRAGSPAGTAIDEFIDLMTVNRAPAANAVSKSSSVPSPSTSAPADRETRAVKRATSTDDQGRDIFWLWLPWRGRRLAELEVNEFAARLGSSVFGDTIKAVAGEAALENVEIAIKDIAQKFEAFGNEVGDYFERRARFLSIVVAFIVAWGFYVQPRELVDTYLNKPEVAATVIQLSEEWTKKFESAKQKADQAGDTDAANREFEEVFKDLQKDIAAGKGDVARLQQAGVPIGWTKERFTVTGFCEFSFLKIPVPFPTAGCLPASKPVSPWPTVFWLLVGGLLVGLGGPFWYDMVMSLTNIRKVVGAASGSGTQKKEKPDEEGGPSPKSKEQPQTPVEHFNVASKARDALSETPDADADDDQAPVG